MLRKVFILFFHLLLFFFCPAQLALSGKEAATPTIKHSSIHDDENVLFATNDDCDLYIDGQLKGEVLRKAFLYVKLSDGRYTYKAISKLTLDELIDTFTVTSGRSNEVFIDLLYLVDQKTAEREAIKKEKEQLIVSPIQIAERDDPLVRKSGKDAQAEIIYSLTANMVFFKGDKFIMGNNKASLPDELEHPASIAPLLFSKYEVTQHQWETLMGYNPSINRNCATCPVENVSWGEVIKFIRKLNVISNKKFRLPTEAEWEYVAKAGGKMEIDTAGGQEKYIQKTAWYFGNSDRKTHPVGIRQPNAAGIFDLTGNVSEWCMNWYDVQYKTDISQLSFELTNQGREKAVRGGNYKDYIGDRFRPSLRNKKIPIDRSSELGFRLVMEVQ